MGLNDEMRLLNAYRSVSMGENKENTSEMYLARLGVERVNIGGGGWRRRRRGGEHKGRDGGNGVEEHYKRLVQENPRNPLFLRNYAQFLYESEKDMSRAEEYYSRAILAYLKDGEVLAQYVNVVWEIHGDQDGASSYFERAEQSMLPLQIAMFMQHMLVSSGKQRKATKMQMVFVF